MPSLVSASRRLAVALAATSTVALAVGVALGHFVFPPAPDGGGNADDGPNLGPTAGVTVPTVVPGPSEPAAPGATLPGAPTRINEFGVPVGYPRTETGAISACGNYVSAYSDVRNREPSRIRQLLESISLPETAVDVADFITMADKNAAEKFGVSSMNDPNVNFNLRVLGFYVESFNEDSSTISIWSMGGTGLYGAPQQENSPQQRWGTDRCTVKWSQGDWKLSDATDGPPGPLITERPSERVRRFFYVGSLAA